jgi:hypothetical protein
VQKVYFTSRLSLSLSNLLFILQKCASRRLREANGKSVTFSPYAFCHFACVLSGEAVILFGFFFRSLSWGESAFSSA